MPPSFSAAGTRAGWTNTTASGSVGSCDLALAVNRRDIIQREWDADLAHIKALREIDYVTDVTCGIANRDCFMLCRGSQQALIMAACYARQQGEP